MKTDARNRYQRALAQKYLEDSKGLFKYQEEYAEECTEEGALHVRGSVCSLLRSVINLLRSRP